MSSQSSLSSSSTIMDIVPEYPTGRNKITQYDPRSKLSHSYIKNNPVAQPNLDSYEQYIENLKKMITNSSVSLSDGNIIRFKNVRIDRPTHYSNDSKPQSIPLFPQYCRRNGKSYSGDIWIECEYNKQTKMFNFGKIPIMLNSSLCHISYLTEKEMREKGESPNDCFGYFIIDGKEKIIVSQERAPVDKLISYDISKDKNAVNIVTEMKTISSDLKKVSVSIRLVNSMNKSVKKQIICFNNSAFNKISQEDKIKTEASKRATNVFAYFEVFGILLSKTLKQMLQFELTEDEKVTIMNTIEQVSNNLFTSVGIANYVLNWFNTDNDSKQALNFLHHTMEEYSSFRGKAVDYLHRKIYYKKYKNNVVDNIEEKNTEQEAIIKGVELLFNNYDHSIYELEDDYDNLWSKYNLLVNKLSTLSFMVARFVEISTGIRGRKLFPFETADVQLNDLSNPNNPIIKGLDDRESIGNKIIDTPGSLLTSLSMSAWNTHMTELVNKLNNRKQIDVLDEIGKIISPNSTKSLSSILNTAIRSGNWGLSSKTDYTGVSRPIQRASVVGAYSDIRTINSSMSSKSKEFHVRSVHYSFWGFICATSTKEGLECGLNKVMTMSSRISFTRDRRIVDNFVDSLVNEDDEPLVSNFKTEDKSIPFFINGTYKGYVNKNFRKILVDARRGDQKGKMRELDFDVSIFEDLDGILHVLCNGGRLIRPVLVVDENQQLVVSRENLWESSWSELERYGAVEYLDSNEQMYNSLIAINISDIGKAKMGADPNDKTANQSDPNLTHVPRYTHCELAPSLLLSYEANIVPFLGMAPGTRVTYEANMAKHAVGITHENYQNRFESAKIGQNLQKPLVYTDVYKKNTSEDVLDFEQMEMIRYMMKGKSEEEINQALDRVRANLQSTKSTDTFGITGVNCMVAIISSLPASYNEEDSIIINIAFLERGGLMSTTFKIEEYEGESSNTEKFGIPDNLNEREKELYSHIDPNTGLPMKGSILRPDAPIISKYTETTTKDNKRKIINTSILVKDTDSVSGKAFNKFQSLTGRGNKPVRVFSSSISNETVVDDTDIVTNGAGKTFRKVKYRITRMPQVGDKFASRFSQKGVIGKIFKQEDMPINEEGMSPDIIMNPHAYPSRMTIGQLVEMLTGKAGLLLGEEINATPFAEVNYEEVEKILTRFGYESNGEESYIDGITGEMIKARIFTGPVYYQILKHMVEEKKHGRSIGTIHPVYRQPTEGRAKKGGLKFGEMERDNLITHGARAWLKGSYCLKSDATTFNICNTCGLFCIANQEKDIYRCSMCNKNYDKKEKSKHITTITGPNSWVLLSQYLAAMSVKVKMTTDKIQKI